MVEAILRPVLENAQILQVVIGVRAVETQQGCHQLLVDMGESRVQRPSFEN